MNQVIVQSRAGVTLVGSGRFGAVALARARAMAPGLVAADAGADRLLALGARPDAVIGDLDSISPAARAAFGAVLHEVAEQDSTDFEKALRAIDAPFTLGLGFSGGRVDHGLAVLNALVRYPARRCVILGGGDATFAAPAEIALDLPPGARLSLFPLAEVTGSSSGLRWPIAGLRFAPGGRIGTSNAAEGRVRLSFDAPGMLVIVPARFIGAVIGALAGG